ncbi:MAG: hypothetical protein MAG795_00454 [Candidatus Woesearchaeota archaeon]|nr:hypothetical protein [Candidatus Woesearchaeota archaeon]
MQDSCGITDFWNKWLQKEIAHHKSKVVEVFTNSKVKTKEQDQLGMIVESLADVAGAELEEHKDLENILVDPAMREISDAIDRYAKDKIVEYYEERTQVYYYVDHKPKKKEADYYIFTPEWVTVLRVSKEELGEGVLGVAYLGMNVIKILDTLYGNDLKEVKRHELLHLQYPHENESWIRQKTMQECGFQTKYQ